MSLYTDSSGESSHRITVFASWNTPDMITKSDISVIGHCRKMQIYRCICGRLFFNGSEQGIQLFGGLHRCIFRIITDCRLFFNRKSRTEKNCISILHGKCPLDIIRSTVRYIIDIRNIRCIWEAFIVHRFYIFHFLRSLWWLCIYFTGLYLFGKIFSGQLSCIFI